MVLTFSWILIETTSYSTVKDDYSIHEFSQASKTQPYVHHHRSHRIFNRVKHSEAAKKVGVELREAELIIFGNPKVGSPLMNCQQSVAIDLPQKALIWKDSEANTWMSYNDPRYFKKRHNISNCEEVISKIEKALASIAKAAATK